MKKLESASGDDFDRVYMDPMIKGHREALKLAQRTAKGAKEAQVAKDKKAQPASSFEAGTDR